VSFAGARSHVVPDANPPLVVRPHYIRTLRTVLAGAFSHRVRWSTVLAHGLSLISLLVRSFLCTQMADKKKKTATPNELISTAVINGPSGLTSVTRSEKPIKTTPAPTSTVLRDTCPGATVASTIPTIPPTTMIVAQITALSIAFSLSKVYAHDLLDLALITLIGFVAEIAYPHDGDRQDCHWRAEHKFRAERNYR